MNNQPSPDLFPNPPRRPRQHRSRLNRRQRIGIGLIFVAGFFFILGGLYAYFDPKNAFNRKTDILLISPEAGPIKERPATPGGVDVQHRDVTIFDHLGQKDAATAQIEHLLPPAEAPNDKAVEVGGNVVVKVPVAPTALAPVIQGPVATPPVVSVPASSPLAQVPTQTSLKSADLHAGGAVHPEPVKSLSTTTPVTIAPVKLPEIVNKAPAQAAAVIPLKEVPPLKDMAIKLGKPGDKPAGKEAPKGKIKIESTPVMPAGLQRVQLAAYPNAQQAEAKMFEIVSGHAEFLRQVKLSVAKADLGSRGTFYRIQSQPMPVPAAHKLCADLKTAGVGCILVK